MYIRELCIVEPVQDTNTNSPSTFETFKNVFEALVMLKNGGNGNYIRQTTIICAKWKNFLKITLNLFDKIEYFRWKLCPQLITTALDILMQESYSFISLSTTHHKKISLVIVCSKYCNLLYYYLKYMCFSYKIKLWDGIVWYHCFCLPGTKHDTNIAALTDNWMVETNGERSFRKCGEWKK